MVEIPSPVVGPADTPKRRLARQALAAVLWDDSGRRRLPRDAELALALSRCRGEDAWWTCEASSAGPVYLLPTVEWVSELASLLASLGVRSVLEVACGDGFLSRVLAETCPELNVTATDDASWTRPSGRMTTKDRAASPGVRFAGIAPEPHVIRMKAAAAVTTYQPDLVLVSWAPPGTLVDRVIRAPSRLVLDIGVDGDICGNGMKTWRFRKEFIDGPVEALALCRLDAKPAVSRATRLTLYYGAQHPEHGLE